MNRAQLAPADPPAPFRRIADDLRHAIESGGLQADEQLPTQNALTQRYGVARMTVQRAMWELKREGLIYTRQGSGSFVRRQPVQDSPPRFAATVQAVRAREDERERLLSELQGSPDTDPDCGWKVWDNQSVMANEDRAVDLDDLLDACTKAVAVLGLLADSIGDVYTSHDVGPRMTCFEADVLAMVMVEGGQDEAAARWLAGHAEGDDEGDAHYSLDEAAALRYARGKRETE